MNYPKRINVEILDQITLYGQLQYEYGAKRKNIENIIRRAERALKRGLLEIKKLPFDNNLAKNEPNNLKTIRQLRPQGTRSLWRKFDPEIYRDKIEGALLARMAGCTLGAVVEGSEINNMKEWAKTIGDQFPPVDYWSEAQSPLAKRYGMSPCQAYTRSKMNGVPVDDDIAYTLLGLLIVEEYGPNFTTEDVGKAWMKYLPIACTAEKIALENLKAGIPAKNAAEKNNPFVQWIGADIRSDPWAYMAPGLPERAAEMAYYDAYLSHRRNGIYGEMFFSAAQAAAFAVDNSLQAVRIGLSEIPQNCLLAKDIRWALKICKEIRNYHDAREAVNKRFNGMSGVHTNNNACLTVFGLAIGGRDVTKVLSETVAMGLDNDCTAATAGSIIGAIAGKKGIPKHWYKNFNDTVHSYLIGKKIFEISDLVKRFSRQAQRTFSHTSC